MQQNVSVRAIGKQVHRSSSTITREFQRNFNTPDYGGFQTNSPEYPTLIH